MCSIRYSRSKATSAGTLRTLRNLFMEGSAVDALPPTTPPHRLRATWHKISEVTRTVPFGSCLFVSSGSGNKKKRKHRETCTHVALTAVAEGARVWREGGKHTTRAIATVPFLSGKCRVHICKKHDSQSSTPRYLSGFPLLSRDHHPRRLLLPLLSPPPPPPWSTPWKASAETNLGSTGSASSQRRGRRQRGQTGVPWPPSCVLAAPNDRPRPPARAGGLGHRRRERRRSKKPRSFAGPPPPPPTLTPTASGGEGSRTAGGARGFLRAFPSRRCPRRLFGCRHPS